MPTVHPYLNFPGTTEQAFTFYRSVFGGDFPFIMRYRDFGQNDMGVPEDELDRIAHVALPIGGGVMLMGTDVSSTMPKSFVTGNNFYIHLAVDSADEAARLFDALGEGGTVEMPLQRTEWAEHYGSVVDRFGVQWMVNHEGSVRYTGPSAA